MKKLLILTTLIVAIGLILPLILVYAGETINEPNDTSSRIPTIISGSGTDQVTNAAPSAQEGNIAKLIQYIYTFAMLAAGIAVIGGLIYGGVRYLFAGGSITKMFAARSQVRNALYGLGLILISYLILYTINPALVNLVNPTADPLKLKTGSIWSLNSSYGMMLGNTPAGRPCVGDFDCNYDLACCPATDTSGNRVSSCRQNFANEANPTGNPDTKTDLKTDPPPKNEPWFQCGFAEPSWLLVSQNTTCENINTFRSACSQDDTSDKCKDKCKDPKNCCDPADISQKYIPDGKKAICCQAPNLVIAKDKPECDFLFGKGGDDPATPGVTENKKNKNSQCADQTGCVPRVATCQPIWPIVASEDKPNSFVKSKWTEKKSPINDKLGDPCQGNFEFKLVQWISNAFGGQAHRDSCQDSRLLCNFKFKTCAEPQSVNGPCEDDSDCCQSRYWWIPACNKYTSRDVSLKCDGVEGYKTCTFKDASDKSKIDEGAGEEVSCKALTGTDCSGDTNYSFLGNNTLCGNSAGTGQVCCCTANQGNPPVTGGQECTLTSNPTCQSIGYSYESPTSCKTTPPPGQRCCCRPPLCQNTCKAAGTSVCGEINDGCSNDAVNRWDTAITAAAANDPTVCAGVNTIPLIKAIMARESSGNIASNDRVSGGLMQLTPKTLNDNSSIKSACGVTDTITLQWLTTEGNAQKQICMAIKYLKTLVSPCGCDVRQLAAGYNGGAGACAESDNCGRKAATDGGQCLMCPGEPYTRKWECPWDNNAHSNCNYNDNDARGTYGYTVTYVPKVKYCYGQF